MSFNIFDLIFYDSFYFRILQNKKLVKSTSLGRQKIKAGLDFVKTIKIWSKNYIYILDYLLLAENAYSKSVPKNVIFI